MTIDQWNMELDRLETAFKSVTLPTGKVHTKEGDILNVRTYIDTNLQCGRANAANSTFSSCVGRLQELEQLLVL